MHFELVFCQKSSKTHILIKLEILFEILAILGPDHLESTILKITGKISISSHLELVITST